MNARATEDERQRQPLADPEPQTLDDIPIRMLDYPAPEPIAVEP
jgi:hypothetical protein